MVELKKVLRKKLKKIRKNLSDENKKLFSRQIHARLFSSEIYANCERILIYVSKTTEVDTFDIIENARRCGKFVSVPKVDLSSSDMNFYNVEGLQDTEVSAFGVLEPNILKCEKTENFSNSLMIVPGIAFDSDGVRLGYGGGFYDRFLQKNKILSVGLCYSCCFCKSLPCESHDMRVNFVVTDNFFVNVY